jgi:hypothetical protein
MAFEGHKQSGVGTEWGIQELRAYWNVQAFIFPIRSREADDISRCDEFNTDRHSGEAKD